MKRRILKLTYIQHLFCIAIIFSKSTIATNDTDSLLESTKNTTSVCFDDKNFTFTIESGVQKRCSWFKKHTVQKETKTAKYCKNDEVATNCRLSCGTCSVNAVNYTSVDAITNNNTSWAPWSFVVFADIHGLTPFAFDPFNDTAAIWNQSIQVLTNIKNNYGGGELVLLPGDMLSFGGISNTKIAKRLGQNMTETNSIYVASTNCYETTKDLFRQAGYGTVLAAVGDHELGGNNGFRVGKKLSTVPTYREGFVDGWNRNKTTGQFKWEELFLGIPSRPIGTPFEGSSFAYKYKNALFVTVDAFKLVGDGDKNYFDRQHGFGGEGAITCDVSGDHLAWFEAVLKAGRMDADVRHIFVQAHLPIIQPVRKVKCSGQFLDGADHSDFWKVMNQYHVDFYFAGEVHSNTVTKTRLESSNLIQVVSRSVDFSGFLMVQVTSDTIELKHYNEVGSKKKFNNNYEQDGYLTVNKTFDEVHIESGGELKPLHGHAAILHFDFEEVFPLGYRQVLGLNGEDSLVAHDIEIDGVNCTESLINHGSFGAQYDGQTSNVQVVEGQGIHGGRAGLFHNRSRFGIFGTGPLSGGEIFSLSLWLQTNHSNSEHILVYYGALWASIHEKKDVFLFTLDHGFPTIYSKVDVSRKVIGTQSIADGQWHHLVVTMPRQSCLFSEMKLYIDGHPVNATYTAPNVKDENVFFMTSGRMNVGGPGYSVLSLSNHPKVNELLPFEGLLDDISVWSRTLDDQEIFALSAHHHTSSSPFPLHNSSTVPSEVPSDTHTHPITTNIVSSTKSPSIMIASGNISPSPTPKRNDSSSPPFLWIQFNSCKDNDEYTLTLQNGETAKCSWIQSTNVTNQQSSLQALYCGVAEIVENCPSSCGRCQDKAFATSSSSMLHFSLLFRWWGVSCLAFIFAGL